MALWLAVRSVVSSNLLCRHGVCWKVYSLQKIWYIIMGFDDTHLNEHCAPCFPGRVRLVIVRGVGMVQDRSEGTVQHFYRLFSPFTSTLLSATPCIGYCIICDVVHSTVRVWAFLPSPVTFLHLFFCPPFPCSIHSILSVTFLILYSLPGVRRLL